MCERVSQKCLLLFSLPVKITHRWFGIRTTSSRIASSQRAGTRNDCFRFGRFGRENPVLLPLPFEALRGWPIASSGGTRGFPSSGFH